MVPIVPELLALSDEILVENFKKTPAPYGRINYYAIFALRCPIYNNLLKELLTKTDNRLNPSRQIIKYSWLVLFAILFHAPDKETKIMFAQFVKDNWSKEEMDYFLNYIKSDETLLSYFL